MRTGRLSRISKKRLAELGQRAEIRNQVLDRDGGCLLDPSRSLNRDGMDWGPCFRELTVHHKLKASQGGGFTEDNLVTLCAGHNDMIEDYPAAAYAIGLVIKPWEAK